MTGTVIKKPDVSVQSGHFHFVGGCLKPAGGGRKVVQSDSEAAEFNIAIQVLEICPGILFPCAATVCLSVVTGHALS